MTSLAMPAKSANPCPIVRPPVGRHATTTCAAPSDEIHRSNATSGMEGGTLRGFPFNPEGKGEPCEGSPSIRKGGGNPARVPLQSREPLMTDKLLMQKDGPIGWIVFNQPDKRNAVSQEMWEAMPGYVKELSSDDAIRVVILRGAGDQAFVSGADISQFKDKRKNMADEENYRRISAAGSDALAHLQKPLLA